MSYLGNINNSFLNYVKDKLPSNTTILNINNNSSPLLSDSTGNNGFHSNISFHNFKNSICIQHFNTTRNIETVTQRYASPTYSNFFVKIRLNISNIKDTNSASLTGESTGYNAGYISNSTATLNCASPMHKATKNMIVFNTTLGLKSEITFNTVCNRDGITKNKFNLFFIILKD